MKKVFVSCPMAGKSDKEIQSAIVKLHQIATLYEGQQLELVHNFNPDALRSDSNEPYDKECLKLLTKGLEKMADCDVFIGVDTYGYRGCEIEERTAWEYGLKVYSVPYQYIFGKYEEHDNKEACCERVVSDC